MTDNMISRLTMTALALPLLASLPGCKEKGGSHAAAPPQVEVVSIEQKDVPIYREWVGTLQSEVNATISAQVSGYLLSRNYAEGTFVTNGQVLFQIDPAPFQAALDQAKAQLVEDQATQEKHALTVKRYRPLVEKQAISQQELDDAVQDEKAAQAKVELDRASVQQAELNLGFTTIRSPVDGVAGLASAQAQVGNLVGPSAGALTTVTTVDPIRSYASVAQALITEIMERRIAEGRDLRASQGREEGVELELMLADDKAYPLKGHVRFANNQVDIKTGTVRVVGEFPNPQRLLMPGMFVRVRALLNTLKGALVVPQRAVTEIQGRSLIALVGADNKVSIRPVEAVERFATSWVIQGDVKAGDRVVAEGLERVRDGTLVTPLPFGAKAAAAGPASAGADSKP
jgi:membrane fusion protein, multidrug efflux system